MKICNTSFPADGKGFICPSVEMLFLRKLSWELASCILCKEKPYPSDSNRRPMAFNISNIALIPPSTNSKNDTITSMYTNTFYQKHTITLIQYFLGLAHQYFNSKLGGIHKFHHALQWNHYTKKLYTHYRYSRYFLNSSHKSNWLKKFIFKIVS